MKCTNTHLAHVTAGIDGKHEKLERIEVHVQREVHRTKRTASTIHAPRSLYLLSNISALRVSCIFIFFFCRFNRHRIGAHITWIQNKFFICFRKRFRKFQIYYYFHHVNRVNLLIGNYSDTRNYFESFRQIILKLIITFWLATKTLLY